LGSLPAGLFGSFGAFASGEAFDSALRDAAAATDPIGGWIALDAVPAFCSAVGRYDAGPREPTHQTMAATAASTGTHLIIFDRSTFLSSLQSLVTLTWMVDPG
jgi:hypothetical protein